MIKILIRSVTQRFVCIGKIRRLLQIAVILPLISSCQLWDRFIGQGKDETRLPGTDAGTFNEAHTISTPGVATKSLKRQSRKLF